MDRKRKIIQLSKLLLLIGVTVSITSCGQLIANAKKEFAQDVSATILEFDDPETIKRGVPAYLILMSSMIKGDPENPDLLESGAQLYGAYASSFTDTEASRKALADRAFSYAGQAICIRDENFCDIKTITYSEFKKRLDAVEKVQAESLFVFVSSWAGNIEANSADWNAIAELPKVKAGLQRVLEVDETVSNGNAHLYMAVMESLLPATLGGKPELAKKHFDRAIELSDGKNLMAKVLYAEKYARMKFDRDLHDKLLLEVIESESEPSDHVLIDTIARQKAEKLFLDGDDYF